MVLVDQFIIYKPGRLNANVDALSRNPVVTETENEENKTDKEDSEISNEDAMKNHGSGGCFVGSKVSLS